jgi:hypothetical protein
MSITKETAKELSNAIERYDACSNLLGEIMCLLAKGLDVDTQYTCISARDMNWVNRNYKKYNEME